MTNRKQEVWRKSNIFQHGHFCLLPFLWVLVQQELMRKEGGWKQYFVIHISWKRWRFHAFYLWDPLFDIDDKFCHLDASSDFFTSLMRGSENKCYDIFPQNGVWAFHQPFHNLLLRIIWSLKNIFYICKRKEKIIIR